VASAGNEGAKPDILEAAITRAAARVASPGIILRDAGDQRL